VECDHRKRLKCISGFCACSSPKYHRYEGGVCVYKLGMLCPKPSNSSEEIQPICGTNMQCIDQRCQCNSGYSPAVNNTKCLKNYGEQCYSYHYNDCNEYQGLKCVFNKCVCMSGDTTDSFAEFYYFDKVSQKCNYSYPLPKVTMIENLPEIHQNVSEQLRLEQLSSSGHKQTQWAIFNVKLAFLLGLALCILKADH